MGLSFGVEYSFKVDKKDRVEVSDMSYADLVDIDLLKEGLKELAIKMNKNFSTQREIKEGDTFKSSNSLVIPEVFNFFLSGAQFEGKVNPYVIYYGKAAMTLEEIDREQGRAGNRGGYSMSINATETEGGLENENIQQNSPSNEKKVLKSPTPKQNTITRNDEIRMIYRAGK